MAVVEQEVKAQYAKFFESKDWPAFKKVAEYYLQTAASLKKRDIVFDQPFKLLLRNVQKRLFIGIACELLLKSFYLKRGYCINKPKHKLQTSPPYKLDAINQCDFREDDTYETNFLIDHLKGVHQFNNHDRIIRGFKVAKVFRNKEAHIAVYSHDFDQTNYTDVEAALTAFYEEAFSEALAIQFAVEKNEKAKFRIDKL
jgi:hypothetical protein